MFRPAFVLSLMVLAVLGFAVYEVEHRVQTLRKELRDTNNQIIADRQEMHVLRAEWSYLNQPSRVNALAAEVLEVSDVAVDQIVSIEDIPMRDMVLIEPAAGVSQPIYATIGR